MESALESVPQPARAGILCRLCLAVLAGVLALAPTTEIIAGDRARSRARDPHTRDARAESIPRVEIDRVQIDSLLPEEGYFIETGPVDFGRLLPGVAREIPAAVRVRVFAARDWVLRIAPDSPLRLLDGRGGVVPHSRLSWRAATTGIFSPVEDVRPAVIARGGATGPAGRLVIVDLRMLLADTDDIGQYSCDLRLMLEKL